MSNTEPLTTAILAAALEQDGRKRLPCAKAFQLAEAHRVPPIEVGRICNEQDVKIVSCQLGCFP